MMKVAVLMGSANDAEKMAPAGETLAKYGVEHEVWAMSAHRNPDAVREFVSSARDNGYGVIIAAAGMAAHLAGVCASCTTLPVIGVPLSGGALDGIDALHSTVQMPPGMPVATVAVNGAQNAALLAFQILAVTDQGFAKKLADARHEWKPKQLS